MWRRLLHRRLPGFLHTGIERIQENDGFEPLRVDALAGDDTVSMTGIDPVTFTTLDGGDGRDRFVGRFDSGFDGNLTLLNFEQTVIRVRGFFSGAITPDAARFDPEETLLLL